MDVAERDRERERGGERRGENKRSCNKRSGVYVAARAFHSVDSQKKKKEKKRKKREKKEKKMAIEDTVFCRFIPSLSLFLPKLRFIFVLSLLIYLSLSA